MKYKQLYTVFWPMFFLITLSVSIVFIFFSPVEIWQGKFGGQTDSITLKWIYKICGVAIFLYATIVSGKETYKIFRRKKKK
jgi:hypothetical protein